MQLLVKRGQSEGALGQVTFDLWAKFEVTEEEQTLLAKYNARNAILSEGNPWRDLRRGLLQMEARLRMGEAEFVELLRRSSSRYCAANADHSLLDSGVASQQAASGFTLGQQEVL